MHKTYLEKLSCSDRKLQSWLIQIAQVSTNQRLANLFTKALEHLQAEFLLCKLGVLNFHFNLMGSVEDQTYMQNSPTKFVKEDQISTESSPTTSTSPCNQQNQAYKETNGNINQSRFHKSRDFVCKKHVYVETYIIEQSIAKQKITLILWMQAWLSQPNYVLPFFIDIYVLQLQHYSHICFTASPLLYQENDS